MEIATGAVGLSVGSDNKPYVQLAIAESELLVAGYSKTPLVKKLGIKDDHLVALIDAPVGLATSLEPLPGGVVMANDLRAAKAFDVIVYFVMSRKELAVGFTKAAKRLQPAGGLWIAWPKKASGIATDLTEDVLREIGLPTGLVDNKVCAIDDTWSGLRFVIRVENRPKPVRGAK